MIQNVIIMPHANDIYTQNQVFISSSKTEIKAGFSHMNSIIKIYLAWRTLPWFDVANSGSITYDIRAPGRLYFVSYFFFFFFFFGGGGGCQLSSLPLVGGEDFFFFWLVSSDLHPQSKNRSQGPDDIQ